MGAVKNMPKRDDLVANEAVWKRVKALVEDDETAFGSKMFCKELPNETDKTYKLRQRHFSDGFINPTQELLGAPGHTIYQNEIKEDIGTGSDRLKKFVENCTKGVERDVSVTQFLREQVCPMHRAYGTTFLVLDMPIIDGEQTEQFQRDNRVWPYVTRVEPLNWKNYEFVGGELIWAAYEVPGQREPWDDPLSPAPREQSELRIWTKTSLHRVMEDENKNDKIITTPNKWGFVPVIIQASFISTPSSVLGKAPFFASSREIVTANNHLNVVNMEIYKHANAMLLIHKSALSAYNSEHQQDGSFRLKKIPEDNAFVWDGTDEWGKPDYLVRDLAVIDHAIAQYQRYMDAAFDNEKSAKSVAKEGYDGSDVAKSGFAMIVEREPILANIVATAYDMESMHNAIIKMADRMINNGQQKAKVDVEYDMNYDIQPFMNLLDETKKVMTEIKLKSPTAKKEQQKRVVTKIVTEPKARAVALKEIDDADFEEPSFSVNSQQEVDGIFGDNESGDED